MSASPRGPHERPRAAPLSAGPAGRLAEASFDVERNGAVRDAIEAFRFSRFFTLLFTLAAGSAAYRMAPAAGGSHSKYMFLVSIACLLTAGVLELHARATLVARLIAEGLRQGLQPPLARACAEQLLRELCHDNAGPEVMSDANPKGSTMSYPDITVTELDLKRLGAVLETSGPSNEDAADRLHSELVRATVLPSEEVPSDLVTMNSRVSYSDESAGISREVTLVYPGAADSSSRRVSVLSPLGSALLGLRVGQAIEWPLPNGRRKRYRVLAVPYQPEACGHFHL